jgi:RNA polymerase sigma-70 factor (ECF subfamily)
MIARRRLIDRMRKRERRPEVTTDDLAWTESGDNPKIDRSELSDDARRAADAFEQLANSQQSVLRLAVHHGLTHEQIAEHTGMPLGTVKTNLRRGLIRLRELLTSGAPDQAMGVRP